MNDHHVEIRYRDQVYRVPSGTRVDHFLVQVDGAIPETLMSALVNQRQVMLDFPLRGEVDLELVH